MPGNGDPRVGLMGPFGDAHLSCVDSLSCLTFVTNLLEMLKIFFLMKNRKYFFNYARYANYKKK